MVHKQTLFACTLTIQRDFTRKTGSTLNIYILNLGSCIGLVSTSDVSFMNHPFILNESLI